MGDFNTNMFSPNHPDKQLETIFESCNLTTLPLEAAHHTSTSHTWIDLMLASDKSNALNYGKMSIPGISSHDLLFIQYSIRVPKQKTKFLTRRFFKRIDIPRFQEDSLAITWQNIYTLPILDEKLSTFNDYVLNLYKEHAPLKTFRVTKPPAPWLTDDLRRLMTARD